MFKPIQCAIFKFSADDTNNGERQISAFVSQDDIEIVSIHQSQSHSISTSMTWVIITIFYKKGVICKTNTDCRTDSDHS